MVRRHLANHRLCGLPCRLSRRHFQAQKKQIYVANWCPLSFIIAVAMLHVVNNLAVLVSIWGAKSVYLLDGVQDAITQWWYGHKAAGCFLTARFLCKMYYFVPK